MNKLRKILRAVNVLFRKPHYINLLLQQDELWYSKYSRFQHKIKQIDLFLLIDDSIELQLIFQGGASIPTDLMLLKGLVRKHKLKSYFEIGTWRGESVLNVAHEGIPCCSLNLGAEELRAMGQSESYIAQIGILVKELKNVTLLQGNSFNYDFAQLSQKYDLIFIDGDHTEKGVKNDTKKVFENLLHENSIVVWHDFAFDPENLRYEVVSAILETVPENLHSNIFHVSNTMCGIYIPPSLGISLNSHASNTSLFHVKMGKN